MGRHAHPGLAGMALLGAKLRELRVRAGISQMMLAGRLGFDPKHGYKYILRLEKGQVPNPTLRTIAGYLEACSAKWQEIVDVMPSGALDSVQKSESAAPLASAPAAPVPPAAEPPAPVKRHDSRPLREQLRTRRIEERSEHARRFWQSVRKAEEQTRTLLRSLRITSTSHPGYLAFTRSCCHALDTPGAAQNDIARQIQTGTKQGLDRAVLERIQAICTEAIRPDTPA